MRSLIGDSVTHALLALPLLGMTASWAEAPVRRVAVARPVVAVRLSIGSRVYRNKLADPNCVSTCLALRDSLRREVRELLRRSYRFINWDISGAAQDTIEIDWSDREPIALYRSQLAFKIKSRDTDVALQNFQLPFEEYAEFTKRDEQGWNQDSLRSQWLRKLVRTFESPDLLVNVFSRIPIGATISLLSPTSARVQIQPDDIGATKDTRPIFQVLGSMLDPADGSQDDGWLRLVPCKTLPDNQGYACNIESFTYTAQPSIRRDSLIALLTRGTLTVKRVRVIDFVKSGSLKADSLLFPGSL